MNWKEQNTPLSILYRPFEQSLIIGGSISIVLIESIYVFRSALRNWINLNLSKYLLSKDSMLHVDVSDQMKRMHQAGKEVIVVRDGVNALLIVPNSIFFVSLQNMFFYECSQFEGNRLNGPLHQYFKLSPELMSLYNTINFKNYNNTRFQYFLTDCILHMILNDIRSLCSNFDSVHVDFNSIYQILQALVDKLQDVSEVNINNSIASILQYVSLFKSRQTSKPQVKTSLDVLRDWSASNDLTLVESVLLSSHSNNTCKLFFIPKESINDDSLANDTGISFVFPYIHRSFPFKLIFIHKVPDNINTEHPNPYWSINGYFLYTNNR
jgi:hypothetical protein